MQFYHLKDMFKYKYKSNRQSAIERKSKTDAIFSANNYTYLKKLSKKQCLSYKLQSIFKKNC